MTTGHITHGLGARGAPYGFRVCIRDVEYAMTTVGCAVRTKRSIDVRHGAHSTPYGSQP